MSEADIPWCTHLRVPAYRGAAARRGNVLAAPMESAAFDHYEELGRRVNMTRCRHAGQWWKASFFITRLAERTEPRKVEALLALRRDDQSAFDVVKRYGTTLLELRAWEKELFQIVEEELWPLWIAGQR